MAWKGIVRMSKNLHEEIKKCYEVADAINNAGYANEQALSLREIIKYEFLKFVIYLSARDNNIVDVESKFVKEYLGFEINNEISKRMQISEGIIPEIYGSQIPLGMKYFVLADVKNNVPNDKLKARKAQHLANVYALFGRNYISCNDKMTENEVKFLTKYLLMLEDFLKEYGLYTEKITLPNLVPGDKIDMDDSEDKSTLEELISNLNALTGLANVKSEVNGLVNLMKVQKLRQESGLAPMDISKHLVFSGNPGTGKTTVARLVAGIYKKLGALSEGQLIEVDRSGLVVGYVGQTATKTQKVIDSALGGILFIDEAYSLNVGKGENDFGQEAVDTLLKAMEDNRDNLVVIVAGYPDLMEQFLASNPGLKSRFSKVVYFDDYTPDEQMEIFAKMLKSKDYKMSTEAKEFAKKHFEERYAKRDSSFANARDVRNYMEHAVSNHATRIVNVKDINKDILTTIEKEDLENIVL